MLKKCTKCLETLSNECFYVRDKGKGLSAKCKKCTCDDHKKKRSDKKQVSENDILYTEGNKRCTSCLEVKSLDSFYRKRNSHESQCKVCKSEKLKENRKKPGVKERNDATRKSFLEGNPDAYQKRLEYSRNYYANNKEKHAKACYNWYTRNKDKSSGYFRKWRLANLDVSTFHAQKRRAQKLKATPIWASEEDEQIRNLYKKSKEMSVDGKILNVDHIVPLQSELVCGLHCMANLEIVEASINFQKGNRWWPDMW